MSDVQSLTLPKPLSYSKPRRRKRKPFGPEEYWCLFMCFVCVFLIGLNVFNCLKELNHQDPVYAAFAFGGAMFQYWALKNWYWPTIRKWLDSGDID